MGVKILSPLISIESIYLAHMMKHDKEIESHYPLKPTLFSGIYVEIREKRTHMPRSLFFWVQELYS